MTPTQIELIIRRAAAHGLDAAGVAELERELELAASAEDVTGETPVAYASGFGRCGCYRRLRDTWPTDDEIVDAAKRAGIEAVPWSGPRHPHGYTGTCGDH